MRPTVFLAMPVSDGRPDRKAAKAYWNASPNRRCRCITGETLGSLLGRNFNCLWGAGLQLAKEGKVSHFAMLHADCGAEPGWLDILVDEMDRLEADVVSAVSPIKDARGVTSTALADPAGSQWDYERRITMRELFDLPETFDAEAIGEPDKVLLVNTACWLADLRRSWWFETDRRGELPIHFTVNDRIVERANGQFEVQCEPEDWFFSRRLHEAGAKVYATRKVAIDHYGICSWPNYAPWGTCAHDQPEGAESEST